MVLLTKYRLLNIIIESNFTYKEHQLPRIRDTVHFYDIPVVYNLADRR